MGSIRTTFTLDDGLVVKARELGINISAAARAGVADAVRDALAEADRAAYTRRPEAAADEWAGAEAWGDE